MQIVYDGTFNGAVSVTKTAAESDLTAANHNKWRLTISNGTLRIYYAVPPTPTPPASSPSRQT